MRTPRVPTCGAAHTCGVAPANAAHTCTPCLATGVGHYAQDDEKALAMVVALQRLGVVAKFYVVANTSNAVDRGCLAKGTLQAINATDEPEPLTLTLALNPTPNP